MPRFDSAATPDEQRIKFINIVTSVRSHPDFKSKYAENPDQFNRNIAMEKIIQDVMLQRRKAKLELYKLYANDPAVKTAWSQSI